MPKRMVDGDRIWTSEKLLAVEPEALRAEYATLIPLALANGSFECAPIRVLRDVYFFNRPSVTLSVVEQILSEYERVKLLFRWKDEENRIWGYWVGIDSKGLLPSDSQMKNYKKGKIPPPDLLSKFIRGEIDSGLPKEPFDNHKVSPREPLPRIGKDRIGLEGTEKTELPLVVNEENGQESDMKAKKEIPAICLEILGIKAEPPQYSVWTDIASLERAHSSGAVVRDFEDWALGRAGDDFRPGPVSEYIREATARFAGESKASGKDSGLLDLTSELTYVSGGKVKFDDRSRIRLSELLGKFTTEEIVYGFKEWLDDQDFSNPKVLQYAAKNFAEQANDQVSYIKRKRKESETAAAEREAAVLRLQEQAEAERIAAQKKMDEEESFDPLGVV